MPTINRTCARSFSLGEKKGVDTGVSYRDGSIGGKTKNSMVPDPEMHIAADYLPLPLPEIRRTNDGST